MVVFAIHRHESGMGVHVSHHPEPPYYSPPQPTPLGCPRAPALSDPLHVWNLHHSSILHTVICMFQCYSVKSSHPCLLPQSPKVCSLHLYLFCCLAYRVIITIFLNSISDKISCSIVSDSLRPHESQHARPPCPSPTPGVHSDLRPSSQ